MALTINYGFSYFGGDEPGTLTEDGSKFTGTDRVLLDRMLKALADAPRHLLTGGAAATPTAPTAAVVTDAGLPGGTTWHYKVALVDTSGQESLSSPEVTVELPAVLVAPEVPLVEAATGGAMAIGLWYYALTVIRDGEESVASTPATITLVTGDSGVTLTMPDTPPVGAVSYQVWRMGASEPGWTRVALVDVATTTVTDLGAVPANACAGAPGQGPPDTNAGVSIYGVTITLSDADAALAGAGSISAWRLYRTATSGSYGASSLVHNVVETTGVDTGTLVTSWTDEGDPPVTGAPVNMAAQMAPAPYVLDHADVLPDATGYPAYYPLVVDGVGHIAVGGSWVALVPPPQVLDHADTLPSAATYPDYHPVVSGGVLYVALAGAWVALGGGGGVAAPTFVDHGAGGAVLSVGAQGAQAWTLDTATATVTTPVTTAGTETTCTLYLTQDAAGSRTLTWPVGVLWAGGTAPTLTTTPGRIDVVELVSHDAGDTWYATARLDHTPPPGSFVAIARSTDTVATSPDGALWTPATLPSSSYWIGLAHGGGVHAAVAYGTDAAATSLDGTVWTPATMPSSTDWGALAYGDGRFVAIAQSGAVATSTDGATWTATGTLPAGTNWYALAYGAGVFVAVTLGTTDAATSPDGVTWTPVTMPRAEPWSALAYGAGLFVALAWGSDAATSPDGVTWTSRVMPSASDWCALTRGGGRFVAVSNYDTAAATSPDGITWSAATLPSVSPWMGVAHSGGLFVAVSSSGDAAATSPDGALWTATTMPSSADWCLVDGA